MLLFAGLLAIFAFLLFWLASRQQHAAGMPGGQVIYADTRGWLPVEKPLYDHNLGLTGRPDYLVKQGDQVIPVEVKSTRIAQGPYDTHIFQLAAYCLLVERTYNVRPDYGILHYPNRTYRINFTSELEAAALDLLEEMRTHEGRKDLPRSHDTAARCHGCGFRAVCDQRLS